jgi:uncharacterized protein
MNQRILLAFLLLALVIPIGFCEDQYSSAHTKIIGIRELEGNEYSGVIADLTVEVRPGEGHVFMDTIPLTKIDTQASARLAREVACQTLSIDCSNLDFFYIIRSSYVMIGGPSAGAALTVATMAALQNVELNEDVVVSGTINPAGSVGPVGGLLQKAEAVHDMNVTVFLVPANQEIQHDPVTDQDVNLIAKAKNEWGLLVVPVEDVIDVYKYMAGIELQKVYVSSTEIASAKLDSALMKLSQGLLPKADDSLSAAKRSAITAALELKDKIDPVLNRSENYLGQAQTNFEDGNYYSASSYAVRSYIDSLYTKNLIDYDKTKNDTAVKRIIDRIDEQITTFENLFLNNKTVDSIDDIEVFAVVIDRMREAEELINESKTALAENKSDTALYLAAYAEVRKNTAYEWLTLADEFKGNLTLRFDQSLLKDFALQRIEESRNSVIYSQTVAGSGFLTQAETLLQDSEFAYNEGKYVFSLFSAAKARALANLALEVSGVTNDTVGAKIEYLENEAAKAIQNAEEKGLTPILALSYLEFAKSLKESDPVEALVFLSYSKEMAQISEEIVIAIAGDNAIAREPPKAVKFYEEVVRIDTRQQLESVAILLVTGTLCGTLIAIAVFESRRKH